jgi:hypothetical protein
MVQNSCHMNNIGFLDDLSDYFINIFFWKEKRKISLIGWKIDFY